MDQSKASPEQKAIAKYFSKRPVLYIGGLGAVLTPIAGLLLSQLLYWCSKGSLYDGWIYKTADEIYAELGMSRNNQETAIRILLKHDLIEYKLAQVPARRHFKLKMENIHKLLPRLKESNKLVYPNPPYYYVKSDQSITKITQKTTTKNTSSKVNEKNLREEIRNLAKLKSIRPP